MVEKHATTGHPPLRIEDLNPRELVAALNLQNSTVDYDATKLGGFPSLSRVPEALEIHAAAAADTVERTTLDWATLQGAIGPELSARVWAAAERYGYKDLAEPSSVSAVAHRGDFFDETRRSGDGKRSGAGSLLKAKHSGPSRGGPRPIEA
jgi:hypothetical protein